MPKTLRLYLPVTQAALAALLMFLNWREKPWTTGTTLASHISYAINAPVLLFTSPLVTFVSDRWPMNAALWFFFSYVIYCVLVAILWYGVAFEIGGTNGSSLWTLLIPRKALRGIADIALVGIGLLLLCIASLNLISRHNRDSLLMVIGALIWGFAIALFYARDLYRTARRV
jgi:hypothetical protein